MFWQLVWSHPDLPAADCVAPLLPKLDAFRHAEALTSVLLMLRRERPTAELIRAMLSREVSPSDRTVTSALAHWMLEHEDRLGDLVSGHLGRQLASSSSSSASGSATSGAKRKRGGGGGSVSHSAEQTLRHLDQLRQGCGKRGQEFLALRSLQQALQQARHACTEVQKRRFMDLFALAESDSETEESQVGKKRKGNPGRSPGKAKVSSGRNSKLAAAANNDSTSEESSDDSEPSSSRPSKASSRGSSGGRGGAKNPSRKRANKVPSYKISSEESSEDGEVTLKRSLPPKKKKKASHSDSD